MNRINWRMFGPCRDNDHADCSEEIHDSMSDTGMLERCVCDCHKWPEDES